MKQHQDGGTATTGPVKEAAGQVPSKANLTSDRDDVKDSGICEEKRQIAFK